MAQGSRSPASPPAQAPTRRPVRGVRRGLAPGQAGYGPCVAAGPQTRARSAATAPRAPDTSVPSEDAAVARIRSRAWRTASRSSTARARPASSGAEAASPVRRSSTAATRASPTPQPPLTTAGDPACCSSGIRTRRNHSTSCSASARSARHRRRFLARTHRGVATAAATSSAPASHHTHDGVPVESASPAPLVDSGSCDGGDVGVGVWVSVSRGVGAEDLVGPVRLGLGALGSGWLGDTLDSRDLVRDGNTGLAPDPLPEPPQAERTSADTVRTTPITTRDASHRLSHRLLCPTAVVITVPPVERPGLRGSHRCAGLRTTAWRSRVELHGCTAASLSIASGADVKVVQQMLGHASATMRKRSRTAFPLLRTACRTGTPDRIRTGATALRGRRARPLHNGGKHVNTLNTSRE